MEEFLKSLLIVTQEALSQAEFIASLIDGRLDEESEAIKLNQQKLIIDIEASLIKMSRSRPKIEPCYFAAICVLSNDETLEFDKRVFIVSKVMKLYGLLTNKNHKEAWSDILKAAKESNITINSDIISVISKTIAKVGGSPQLKEFL